jgi:hypothetical protein
MFLLHKKHNILCRLAFCSLVSHWQFRGQNMLALKVNLNLSIFGCIVVIKLYILAYDL